MSPGLARSFAVTCLLLFAACAATVVSPQALRSETEQDARAAEALELWEEAVALANDFLASDARQTLPPGSFDLSRDVMLFVTEDEIVPLEIQVTGWGTMFNKIGFVAQERSWGFVIGSQGQGSRLYANSLFLDEGDDFRHPARVAELILHETTHVVFDLGTVSFCGGLAYYLEALFTFSYRNHSAERRPFATSEEFNQWFRDSGGWD